jgi:hypothetical protein
MPGPVHLSYIVIKRPGTTLFIGMYDNDHLCGIDRGKEVMTTQSSYLSKEYIFKGEKKTGISQATESQNG